MRAKSARRRRHGRRGDRPVHRLPAHGRGAAAHRLRVDHPKELSQARDVANRESAAVKKHILVLGGGFAGLWSAIGAARELSEQKTETEAAITLVDRTTYHNIRVRNYEADLG